MGGARGAPLSRSVWETGTVEASQASQSADISGTLATTESGASDRSWDARRHCGQEDESWADSPSACGALEEIAAASQAAATGTRIDAK